MPQIFKLGSYVIYFWSNEGEPLEPIHVHVAQGNPTSNATKIWLTKNGKCSISNNNSKIPEKTLKNIERIIEARYFEIVSKWQERFGRISFYC